MTYVVPVPASVAVITSLAGPRINPITHVGIEAHGGLDLGVPRGTRVGATAAGTVTSRLSCDKDNGNAVFLRHDDGRHSVYLHMSSVIVNVGQHVVQNQMLGASGGNVDDPCRGSSNGAHLHFEIRGPGGQKADRLDPLAFMPGTFRLSVELARELGRATIAGGAAAISLGTVAVVVIGALVVRKWMKKRSR